MIHTIAVSICEIQINILFQQWWHYQLGSHCGQMSESHSRVLTAIFTEHTDKHCVFHALYKLGYFSISELVRFRDFFHPCWFSVPLSEMKTPLQESSHNTNLISCLLTISHKQISQIFLIQTNNCTVLPCSALSAIQSIFFQLLPQQMINGTVQNYRQVSSFQKISKKKVNTSTDSPTDCFFFKPF